MVTSYILQMGLILGSLASQLACTKSATPGKRNSDPAVEAKMASSPTASLASGNYTGTQTVTLTSSSEGATIYYTTDGDTPSVEEATKYAQPLTLTRSSVVKAIAHKDGYHDSEVATFNYSITPTGSVSILNLHAGHVTETGFVIGTASADSAAVGCQFDSGEIVEATGTTSWSCALPNGADTWKLNSSHTVSVGILSEGKLYSKKAVTVKKGINKDINGDGYADLAVGAYQYNNGSVGDGGMYIYYGSSSGIATGNAGDPTIGGKPNSASGFGWSSALGDLNGDGFADLAAGAYGYNNGSANDGAVYIYYGSAAGIATTDAGTPTIGGKTSSGSAFGDFVRIGDLNADGLDDLVVGAYNLNNGSAGDGGIYIYYGAQAGITSTTANAPTIGGKPSSASQFGISAAVDDFDGDEIPDLVVGASGYNNGAVSDGGLYIYLGSDVAGLPANAGTPTIKGMASTAGSFGFTLATGDFNGDTYADLGVGAFTTNDGVVYNGGAYIYNGSSSGIASGTAGAPTIAGKPSGAGRFGRTLAVGDLDSDGYSDLIVGARTYNNGSANDGGVYLYSGSSSGIASTTAGNATIAGKASAGSNFSYTVSVTNLNGDAHPDLVVGAYLYNNGAAGDGGLYVYDGDGTNTFSSNAGNPTLAGKPSSAGNFGILNN